MFYLTFQRSEHCVCINQVTHDTHSGQILEK